LRRAGLHPRRFGVTSINHPLPVDENTLFQIGSTTKTFTVTAAILLVGLNLAKPEISAP